MRRIRNLLYVLLVLFIAYCVLDSGYSYWTDSVTISGNVRFEHNIELTRIEPAPKEIEASDKKPEQEKDAKVGTSKKDSEKKRDIGIQIKSGMERNSGIADNVKKNVRPSLKKDKESSASSKKDHTDGLDTITSEDSNSEISSVERQDLPMNAEDSDEKDGIAASVSPGNDVATNTHDSEQAITETGNMESDTGTSTEEDRVEDSVNDSYELEPGNKEPGIVAANNLENLAPGTCFGNNESGVGVDN